MVFVRTAKAPPKAGANEVLYSLNLIDEFASFFSPKVIYVGLPRKAFPLKQAFVDINVFLCLRKQRPRFAQGEPKGYFKMKELDIKNLIGPLKLLSQCMKCGKSWMPTCANMCHHVATWANIAVCQLCRERQPLWNSHGPELFHDAGLLRKAFPESMPLWTSVFLGGWASNSQDSPKASPRVIFHRKNLTEQLKLILKWILIERWTRPSILSSMCQHVARLQFDSCAEKDSLCGTVMIYDGLNLRCLDQCHCVRSHGKSSSQSWRKRIVIQQSEFIHERQRLL